MNKLLVLLLGAVLSAGAFANKEECEDNVDMADSLDFQKMHVDCADDPVTLYDPESKGSFLSKSAKTVTTYGKDSGGKKVATQSLSSQGVSSASEIQHDVAQLDNSGVIFNIREPFSLTGGPQSALNGLFVQMAQYCKKGWTKQKEWVEPAESGFYLHYQFRCAE